MINKTKKYLLPMQINLQILIASDKATHDVLGLKRSRNV